MTDNPTTDEATPEDHGPAPAEDPATDPTTDPATEDQLDEQTPGPAADDTDPETFPAKVVKDLRKENARYRERAGLADGYARRLHTALVAATGKLADPTDLDFDEAHLDDDAALSKAVDELVARKPHLKARRVGGDVGQGTRGAGGGKVDLIGLMRGGL
ncbi:MAG: hypothetical protein Q4G67_12245 [Actinomycetia bacterium]|nr:hypothetical protein [Actinomycetes bacterium]